MRHAHHIAATAALLSTLASPLMVSAQSSPSTTTPAPSTASAPSPTRADSERTPIDSAGPVDVTNVSRASALRVGDSTLYVPGILTTRSLERLGIATLVLTAAMTPLDAMIARNAQAFRGAGTGPVERVASTLNWIGDPGSVVIPVAVLGTGLLSGNSTLREIGLHASESVVLTGGVTALVKGVAGRRRPTPGQQDMDDFSFDGGFRGGNAESSFPSGHTTGAFALATTLTLETMRFDPAATKLVAITSFGIATGVGMARVYTNHHWASDVVLGAGIGTIGALVVERYAHGGLVRHRTIASLMPSTMNVAQNGQATLGWTIPFSR